jgi:hypothetical protein
LELEEEWEAEMPGGGSASDWQTVGDDILRALIMFEEMEQPEFGTLIW